MGNTYQLRIVVSKNITEPSAKIITHLLFWAGGEGGCFLVVWFWVFFFFFPDCHKLDEKGVGEILVNGFGRKRKREPT